jgi:hypothetical protein
MLLIFYLKHKIKKCRSEKVTKIGNFYLGFGFALNLKVLIVYACEFLARERA